MFNHLQDLSFSYFDRTPVGWIMSRVTSDSDRIADLVTWGLLDVTWAVMNIVTAMFFMLLINWRLALIVLAIIPILLVVAVAVPASGSWSQFRQVRKINSKITGAYNENITGVRVVKALGREEENLREFGELTGDMYRASFRAAWLSALFLPVVQIISRRRRGRHRLVRRRSRPRSGGMTIGGIQAFVSYITFMMWPIQDLARVYAEHAARHRLGRARLLADRRRARGRRPAGRHRPRHHPRRDRVRPRRLLLRSRQAGADRTSRSRCARGETIALVGPTGGGKTTIVNLLCRFYEPKRGAIRIGGRDYTDLTLHAIQSRIGIVLQTPHLFSGTVRENIRYGRLDATDEEVEEAARLAGAHEFIVDAGEGLRRGGGRGRQPALGRAEAAHQPGARRAGPARDLHHGRGHQLGRHADRRR